jgi:hypothetical protein
MTGCYLPTKPDPLREALLQARQTGVCRFCGEPAIGVTCSRPECVRRWLISVPRVEANHDE